MRKLARFWSFRPYTQRTGAIGGFPGTILVGNSVNRSNGAALATLCRRKLFFPSVVLRFTSF
jgi:hypothetical protein